MMFKTLLLLTLSLSLSISEALGQENIDETTFILVRHAEKVDDSYDPDLSDLGYERVEKLTEKFERVNFDAVYSTPVDSNDGNSQGHR